VTAEHAGMGAAAAIAGGLVLALATFVKRRTVTDVDGSVLPPDVQQLADQAGYDPAVYALARVGACEAGGQRQIAKAGVMWVVMNEAARRRSNVVAVILGSAQAFGPQGQGGRGFVSSSHDPQTIDLTTAQGVVDGSIDDPTGGALNFDSPRSYADPSRADTFAANREAEGKELVTLDGVPESTFRFWRPA
jgi:hypothetical protein